MREEFKKEDHTVVIDSYVEAGPADINPIFITTVTLYDDSNNEVKSKTFEFSSNGWVMDLIELVENESLEVIEEEVWRGDRF